MEGGRLRGGGRRREQGFGVLGKVLRAVGRVEAFGEDDDFGASARGFENFCAGVGEICGLVGACGELDKG